MKRESERERESGNKLQVVLRSLSCVVKAGVDDVDVAVLLFCCCCCCRCRCCCCLQTIAGCRTENRAQVGELWVEIGGGKVVLFVEYEVNVKQQSSRVQATFFIFTLLYRLTCKPLIALLLLRLLLLSTLFPSRTQSTNVDTLTYARTRSRRPKPRAIPTHTREHVARMSVARKSFENVVGGTQQR